MVSSFRVAYHRAFILLRILTKLYGNTDTLSEPI